MIVKIPGRHSQTRVGHQRKKAAQPEGAEAVGVDAGPAGEVHFELLSGSCSMVWAAGRIAEEMVEAWTCWCAV